MEKTSNALLKIIGFVVSVVVIVGAVLGLVYLKEQSYIRDFRPSREVAPPAGTLDITEERIWEIVDKHGMKVVRVEETSSNEKDSTRSASFEGVGPTAGLSIFYENFESRAKAETGFADELDREQDRLGINGRLFQQETEAYSLFDAYNTSSFYHWVRIIGPVAEDGSTCIVSIGLYDVRLFEPEGDYWQSEELPGVLEDVLYELGIVYECPA